MKKLVLLFGTLACLSGCRHIPAPEPGSVQIHFSGETADAIRKVWGHTAISPSRYGTIYLIPADQVTPYLKCHEGVHNAQFATYETDAHALGDYSWKFVKALVDDAIENPSTHILRVVQKILSGTMSVKQLAVSEIEDILRLAYRLHPLEIEASKACEHLR